MGDPNPTSSSGTKRVNPGGTLRSRQEYDIIGDVHGHARELRALLEKMGYRESTRRLSPLIPDSHFRW